MTLVTDGEVGEENMMMEDDKGDVSDGKGKKKISRPRINRK